MAGEQQMIAIDFLGLHNSDAQSNIVDINRETDANPVEGRGDKRVPLIGCPPAQHLFDEAEAASLECLKLVTGHRKDQRSVSLFSKRDVHIVRKGGVIGAVETVGGLLKAKPMLSSLSLKGNAGTPVFFENISGNLVPDNSIDKFQPFGGSFVMSCSSDAQKSCSQLRVESSASQNDLGYGGLNRSQREKIILAVKSLEELTDLQQIPRERFGLYMNDKARSLHQVDFLKHLDDKGQALSELLIPNFQLSQTETYSDLQYGNAFPFQSVRENRSSFWGKEGQSCFAVGSQQYGPSLLNCAIQMPEANASPAQNLENGELVPDADLCLFMSNLKEHSMSSQLDSMPVSRVSPTNSLGKSLNAQLTIFYAGTVSVYEAIPADKAQAIMFLAGSGSMLPGQGLNTLGVQSISSSVPAHISSVNGISFLPGMVSPPPVTHVLPQFLQSSLQTGQLSPSGQPAAVPSPSMHNCGSDGSNRQVFSMLSSPSTQSLLPVCSPPLPIVALPQARKASLARFLEKRRERVYSKLQPYPIKKSFPECTSMPRENAHTASVSIFEECHKEKLGILFGDETRVLLGDMTTCKLGE
eukprot:c14462_g1_i2 orf=275-2023(+)